MKLSNSEYTTLCSILGNRGYRYYDVDDSHSDAYKIYSNILERVVNSKENSVQRYTPIQKEYLIDMLQEYFYYNHPDETKNKDIISMLYKLTGKHLKLNKEVC